MEKKPNTIQEYSTNRPVHGTNTLRTMNGSFNNADEIERVGLPKAFLRILLRDVMNNRQKVATCERGSAVGNNDGHVGVHANP